MSRLSATERELEELAASGMDGEALVASVEDPPVHGDLFTIVMGYDDDGATVPVDLGMLAKLPNLQMPFMRVMAHRAGEQSLASLMNERWRLSRFVAFLAGRKPDCRLQDIDDALLDDFRDWLNDHVTRVPVRSKKKHKRPAIFAAEGGKKLAAQTKIIVMFTVLTILRRLRVGRRYASEIRPELDLIRGSDWTAPGRRIPTAVLTRPQLKLLVRICREEVVEITARLEAAWAVIDGKADAAALGNLVDPALLDEVVRIDRLFDHKPPVREKFKNTPAFDRETFPRLFACNSKQYNAAIALIYPSGRLLMPFMLLLAIYYRYNPSVLAKLEFSDFSRQPSVRGERMVGAPFKARSGRTQVASWPVTDDAHNPAQMLKTLERWTSIVRESAPHDEVNHIFLARLSAARVRSFASVFLAGRSLRDFLADHGETLRRRFHLKSLRPTVINLVHHLFDGDLMATLEVGQQLHVDTVVDHYLSDGARQLNDELLVPVYHARDSWLRTSGKLDPREGAATRFQDAATPGWECEDRYFNPFTERPSDLFCAEYGMCVKCQMGRARVSSPQAYAYAVKLREAIRRSRTTMLEHVWLTRWMPILDHLERKGLRSFDEAAIEMADLDIPPLPTVE